MRLALAAAVAALGTAAALAPAMAQSGLDFSLVNRTGYQIDEVYVSPASASAWGSDVMGRNVLGNGSSVDIRFNGGARGCSWDLKVVYNDGDQSEWQRLNLCQISKVTLYWNRQAGTTRAVTE